MRDSPSSSRRRFLGAAAASALAASITPWESLEALPIQPSGFSPWDLSWLETIRGKHRQVFDTGDAKDFPLNVVGNWLRAYREVYGLGPSQLSTVVAVTGGSFPLNASDPLWVKYPLGRLWEIKDPRTGEWAIRNVFADVSDSDNAKVRRLKPQDAIPALVGGGTIFWQCNNALQGVAHMVADEVKGDFSTVHDELLHGMYPHVKLVPAHTMLIGLAQEHGCAYQAL